jgi:hypothetical protein
MLLQEAMSIPFFHFSGQKRRLCLSAFLALKGDKKGTHGALTV